MDEPIILEGIIEGNHVRRILVDAGSSSEIMYEHCFRNLKVNIRSRLRRCGTPMIGFLGEKYHPLGVIDIRITMGNEGRSKTVLMDFAIIKCCSPYNIIIGRTRMRNLRAVMDISVISISLDSLEDSVGTPAGRVILFDYTPASPDSSPASDSESDLSEDPSSDHIPPLPDISPFLSSDDDTTDSDTPDTPSSPTHDTPFTEITASTQRSPIIPHRRVMLLSPGQPIPHGRPYRYHLNGPVHMMTARKRVGPLPTHRLDVRHSTDHSSSYSSLEASPDFHSDASSDSSSRHPLSDHSSPDLPGTSAGSSRKRRRSPMTSVPALSPISGALSPVRADLIPSPKRVKDSGYLADVEIDECIAYADALRDRGIDARVVVEAIDRDETETGMRGPVEVIVERVTHPAMPKDIPESAQEGAVEVTYETIGDLV
ncbi:reverse transcriptase domain-containing protein [Tanacetum coccineum]